MYIQNVLYYQNMRDWEDMMDIVEPYKHPTEPILVFHQYKTRNGTHFPYLLLKHKKIQRFLGMELD